MNEPDLDTDWFDSTNHFQWVDLNGTELSDHPDHNPHKTLLCMYLLILLQWILIAAADMIPRALVALYMPSNMLSNMNENILMSL